MKFKRKWLIIGSISIFLVLLLFYALMPKSNSRASIDIEIEDTMNFSTEELDQGVETVISYFNHNWSGATLKSIHFDNAWYQNELSNNENTSYSHIPKENVLIFLTDFKTGRKTDGSVSPHTEISSWQIILTRKTKNSPWQVIDQGV